MLARRHFQPIRGEHRSENLPERFLGWSLWSSELNSFCSCIRCHVSVDDKKFLFEMVASFIFRIGWYFEPHSGWDGFLPYPEILSKSDSKTYQNRRYDSSVARKPMVQCVQKTLARNTVSGTDPRTKRSVDAWVRSLISYRQKIMWGCFGMHECALGISTALSANWEDPLSFPHRERIEL